MARLRGNRAHIDSGQLPELKEGRARFGLRNDVYDIPALTILMN